MLRALQAGAAGFILKDTAPGEIVRAIESVHNGDGSLSPRIARRLIDLVADEGEAGAFRQRAHEQLATLTAREYEVATAVGHGCSNADIASQRHMSLATVKAHISRILTKHDADNRVQIALRIQEIHLARGGHRQ